MAQLADDTTARRRTRASETAMRAALKALVAAGVTVDRVVVRGGEVEILCQPVEQSADKSNDRDLEQW